MIAMPKKDALTAFRAYRKAVRERYSKEDAALMRGYKALAKGRQVIDLFEVMRQAGTDDRGRPKLAISRADLPRIWMRRRSEGACEFTRDESRYWRRKGTAFYRIRLPEQTFTDGIRSWNVENATAIVPVVPPQFRPAHSLSGYHILWEAEWADAPHDPMLLKHLGGALYAVLAVWDLTELERAVLRGRRA